MTSSVLFNVVVCLQLHMRSGSPLALQQMAPLEEDEDEEGLQVADTYNDYMPAKCTRHTNSSFSILKLAMQNQLRIPAKIGCRHPDQVVETSSLASVEPVDIHYKLAIPERIIDCGNLSALQLETIVYASQKHQTFLPSGERAGFLTGKTQLVTLIP